MSTMLLPFHRKPVIIGLKFSAIMLKKRRNSLQLILSFCGSTIHSVFPHIEKIQQNRLNSRS